MSGTENLAIGADHQIRINATDIERFIYMFADRFFHEHQFEYPQTVKIFQEFKSSFFNERIMNIRSMQNLMIQQNTSAAPKLAVQQHQPQHVSSIDDFFLRTAVGSSNEQRSDSNEDNDTHSLARNIRSMRDKTEISNETRGNGSIQKAIR